MDKKYFKRIIFSLFCLGLVIFSSGTVYAASSGKNDINVGVTLLSEEVPENLISLVKGRLTYFDSILLNDEGVSSGDKSIGMPFSVYDDDAKDTYYYFPLYHQNELIKTIFCYYDSDIGQWQTNMSGHLIDVLTEFFEKKEDSEKVGFLQKNADIYLVDENLTASLFNDSPLSEGFINPDELEWDEFDYRDLTEEYTNTLLISISSENKALDRLFRSQGQKYLNLDFLENQGSTSWCAAYATTSIIRYHTKNQTPTAQQMIRSLHPNSSNLPKESASNAQCIQYANGYGFHNISNRWGVATVTETATEINANRPYWVSALGQSGNYDKKRHAFVVRGYANFDFYRTISVWNPWSTASYGYDLLDPSSNLITTHGSVWKQDSGLFSWHYR
ncbi:C47 family peptidase [Enterococcus sp. FSL R5-0957]|uniref:C47 family peptidase n=1 Tax=Enterococcus sp. FSL R5-0957 TaxID=2921725 RepID=UPI0030F88561